MYWVNHQYINETIYSLEDLSRDLFEIGKLQESKLCSRAAEIIEQQHRVLREIDESRKRLAPSDAILALSGIAFWVIALLWILSYFGLDLAGGRNS